jgi:hypothetical protein
LEDEEETGRLILKLTLVVAVLKRGNAWNWHAVMTFWVFKLALLTLGLY